jgi:hypothetical protein
VEALRAGDQLNSGYGYYICDPVFAEAVREALELGYRLVPYEARPDQEALKNDTVHVDGGREQGEATNLEQALAAAPDGRFLVYVGYGHLVMDLKAGGGARFGGLFAKDTGVAPLTVVQDSTGSFGPHGPDAPSTTALLTKYRPSRCMAVAPLEKSGGWTPDLLIYHPDLPDVHGRPGWLAADPQRRRVTYDLPRPIVETPVLAQAIRAGDTDPALPADQYLLERGARALTFYLRSGRYRVRLETSAGFEPLGDTVA